MRDLKAVCLRRRFIGWIGLAALVTACSEDPVGPDASVATLVRTDTSALRGVAGEVLTSPVSVRAVDADGRAISGATVQFEPVAGGGTAYAVLSSKTDFAGRASARWRLGSALQGTQRLRARLTGARPVDLIIEATAVPRSEADVLVVRGALGPLLGLVVVQDVASTSGRVQERVSTDTVFHLNPMSAIGTDVVVFSRHNRPLRETVLWTGGIDTIHVTLRPPLEVRIDVIVHAGTFETQAGVSFAHRLNMEALWRSSAIGLRVGSVTVTNAIGTTPNFPVNSATLCAGRTPGSAIQTHYVTDIDAGRYDGWGCLTGHTFMSLRSGVYSFLLAHELGHTFALNHTPNGMMYPNSPGTEVTEGEVFRAHFHSLSALNTIFGAQPASSHCLTLNSARCLPELYQLGSLTGVGTVALARANGRLPAFPSSRRALDAWPTLGRRW